MQLAYAINLAIHACAGLTAVAVLPVPLIARKGGAVHRRAGWVFVVAMAIVAVTGLALAAAWATVPLEVKPPTRSLDDEALAELERSYRAFALFFATLGVLSASSIWHGISALRLPTDGEGSRRSPSGILDHLAYAATVLCGGGLLALGLGLGHGLFIAFGLVALVSGLADARFILRPIDDPCRARIIRHLQSMLGGATAALTAFSALTLRRMVGAEGAFAMSFWLIPVILGVLATVLWTRRW